MGGGTFSPAWCDPSNPHTNLRQKRVPVSRSGGQWSGHSTPCPLWTSASGQWGSPLLGGLDSGVINSPPPLLDCPGRGEPQSLLVPPEQHVPAFAPHLPPHPSPLFLLLGGRAAGDAARGTDGGRAIPAALRRLSGCFLSRPSSYTSTSVALCQAQPGMLEEGAGERG